MKKFIFAMLTMLLAQAAFAQNYFLKCELIENDDNAPTEIKLSIPLGLLEAMKPSFDEAIGHAKLETHGVNLREIWEQIRNAGPNEYVNINSDDQNVRVSTTETHIVVDVEGDENIHLTVPLAVVEAIFGGDNIDFDQMIDALVGMAGQDLLNITGDVTARAWVE